MTLGDHLPSITQHAKQQQRPASICHRACSSVEFAIFFRFSEPSEHANPADFFLKKKEKCGDVHGPVMDTSRKAKAPSNLCFYGTLLCFYTKHGAVPYAYDLTACFEAIANSI